MTPSNGIAPTMHHEVHNDCKIASSNESEEAGLISDTYASAKSETLPAHQ